MEKLILVHYIYIGGMESHDAERYMYSVAKALREEHDDSIIAYWIPVKTGETRVECLNPKLVSKKDYAEAKRILDRNQKTIDDIVKQTDYKF